MPILAIVVVLLLIAVLSSTREGRAEVQPKVDWVANRIAKPILVLLALYIGGFYIAEWLGLI